MTINLKLCDENILYKRKQGYTPTQILKYRQSEEPFEEDLISLNHIARVCFENDLPI